MKTIIVVFLLSLVSACSWFKSEGGALKDSVIDCTTSNITTLTKQFGPTVDALVLTSLDPSTGKMDWNPLKSAAKNFGADTGMCVLANAVSKLFAPASADEPQSSPLLVDKQSVLEGFNELRSSNANGKQFKLTTGVL